MTYHIGAIYKFKNGMCAVFDIHGRQIVQLQGTWEESKKKLKENDINTDYCEWLDVPFDERLEIETASTPEIRATNNTPYDKNDLLKADIKYPPLVNPVDNYNHVKRAGNYFKKMVENETSFINECSHEDVKVITIREHAHGGDEVPTYHWCKDCGALHCDDGYKKSEWTLPRKEKL